MTELWAHASGALWLPELSTAIIADLHLGYAWAQRRRGELGPISDGGVAEKLRVTLDELQPQRVVLLGDIYHAPKPSPSERKLIEDALALITGELIIVRGNHDRSILRDFGKAPVPDWRAPGLIAVHGDRLPETNEFLIMGHLHPIARFRDAAGVTRRVPVFAMNSRCCVLPAFSPFAAGGDVRGYPRLFAATGKRVVELTKAGRPQVASTLLRIK